MIHYIVSVYVGKRNNNDVNKRLASDPLYFVNAHIKMLNSLNVSLIKKVTFVISPSEDSERDNLVFNYIDSYRNQEINSRFNMNVILRDSNDFYSYGSWKDGIMSGIDEDLHFFLIEDDYIPAVDNFYDAFIEKIKHPKAGYVCQWWREDKGSPRRVTFNPHAAISNGLLKNEAAKMHLRKYNEPINLIPITDKIYDVSEKTKKEKVHPGVISQLHFLDNFKKLGYTTPDINSEYCNPFLEKNGSITIYGNKEGRTLIQPIEIKE